MTIATKGFVMLFAVKKQWQMPAIASVEFIRAEENPVYPASDKVFALRGGKEHELVMLREDYEDLRQGDTFLILDNYFVTPGRPAQYRLSPMRLILEYPEPLFFLCLFFLWRMYRRRLGMAEDAAEAAPMGPMQLLKDDFHQRAELRRKKTESK